MATFADRDNGLWTEQATVRSAFDMSNHRKRTKQEVCEQFIVKLRERPDVDTSASGFFEKIRQHFQLLPTRYALDVNIEGIDVLSHERLLNEARADPSSVSFAVRPVDVVISRAEDMCMSPVEKSRTLTRKSSLPRPSFGSSPNLQALALEAGEKGIEDACAPVAEQVATFWEITIASIDQPKLLSRLSEALSDVGLNIREAHAFNSSDGFSLDVFVVDGWQASPDGMTLEDHLGQRLGQLPPPPPPRFTNSPHPPTPAAVLRIPQDPTPTIDSEMGTRPSSPTPDDWEIDISQLHIESKIASGSFANLYKGYYCGTEVAVKILKDVQDDTSQYQEFLQEVSIMRKVRHKHVVQFIGACTRKPNLCIVFEYMAGGSVYDRIRKEGPLRLSQVLKLAVDVSRGMDYLHQRKIIHRDLKAANLLLDENDIVKIADFGVARVIECSGAMTAETGTYRWMAPEVIEHKPYDERADVFSFAVVLWELLTCKIPYSDMTPLQAAVGVVQKGLRPGIPPNCPPALAQLLEMCWAGNPAHRPAFKDLTPRLQQLLDITKEEETRKAQKPAGLLSKLRGKS